MQALHQGWLYDFVAYVSSRIDMQFVLNFAWLQSNKFPDVVQWAYQNLDEWIL